MDVLARTFVPAATAAGLDVPAIGRLLPIFRRCLGADAVLLVTRCTRPERPLGDYVLVLTRYRLVVVQESRVVHRLRLHLDAPLHELADVSWVTDPAGTTVELSATAIDGIRERFTIRRQRAALDRVLAEVFGQLVPTLSTAA
jgi:hypothetical protein